MQTLEELSRRRLEVAWKLEVLRHNVASQCCSLVQSLNTELSEGAKLLEIVRGAKQARKCGHFRVVFDWVSALPEPSKSPVVFENSMMISELTDFGGQKCEYAPTMLNGATVGSRAHISRGLL